MKPSRLEAIRALVLSSALAGLLAAPHSAFAQQSASLAQEPSAPAQSVQSDPTADARAYCQALSDEAGDARLEWQMRAIFAAKEDMNAKLTELEEKIAELKRWVEKRDEILRRAEGHVVQIYATMRADAAAEQLSTLDDTTAVSVLLQMKPRQAGGILAEMPASRAAYLADSMAYLTQQTAKGAGL